MASAAVEERPRQAESGSGLVVGTRVAVRNRFDGSWCRGFEIAAVDEGREPRRYHLRRLSDGSVLPAAFAPHQVTRTW